MDDNATILPGNLAPKKYNAPPSKWRLRSLSLFRLFAPISTVTGKVQVLGLSLVALMAVLAIFAPFIAQFGPRDVVCGPFSGPTTRHWLGCNDFGQDLFAQLLYGARVSLFVGILVASLSTLIATILALLAGYHAGQEEHSNSSGSSAWIDKIIMRMVDVALSLPFLPLVIVLGVYFGASIQTQILVITLVMWAHPVRELRSQILSIRAATFVEASRVMGASSQFVSLRHILPELAPLIVPQFVRIAHNAILVEAALSFLGLGDPLQNSWGSILFHANARAAFLTGTWTFWIVPPGLAISLTVVAFAFIGYGFDASISRQSGRKGMRPEVKPASNVSPDDLLIIEDLDISYPNKNSAFHAVQQASLNVRKGELLGLVGESGSGKSSIALAILDLLREPTNILNGSIQFDGTALLLCSMHQMGQIRAKQIALIPQSAMNALNPVLTIGDQLNERLALTGSSTSQTQEAKQWMIRVGLKPSHLQAYPHELSGGMRQRAVIAIALCAKPQLVIADEPTTGLDVLVQESIMHLLLQLRREMGLSILFVTHNLQLIARHCDRLAVMHQGQIVETGTPDALISAPDHPHTKALFDNLPQIHEESRWRAPSPSSTSATLLSFSGVSKSFTPAKHGLWGKFSNKTEVKALNNISFSLKAGEVLGLVGGSGAGKSTIARLIMGATAPSHGKIELEGRSWQDLSKDEVKALRRKVQMVFQDPYQSINNRLTIAEIVAEPLLIHQGGQSADYKAQIQQALDLVRLPSDDSFLSRLPISLSGGQRQRVAFARAILTNPALIVSDEPTSMLDQSIRMDVMNVMDALRKELGTSFIFITHDIALARHFCDRLIVLQDGHIVEQGTNDAVIANPIHPYTKALIAAV